MLSDGPGIVWFRRDLRLDDNPAWAAATAGHPDVVALFVLEPSLLASASDRRRDQLLAHLAALDNTISDLGGHLVVRHAPAVDAVAHLVAEVEATALYFNIDTSPFAVERDAAVSRQLEVPVHTFAGSYVHEPGAVLTQRGTLSQVFTPFYKKWRATPLTPWPDPGTGRPLQLRSEPIPEPAEAPRLPAGARAAFDRLVSWLELVDDYPETRDLPALQGTSDLSSDLKFGTLAARSVLDVVGESTPGREAFVRQLAWRDWWAHTLGERPDLAQRAVRPE